MAQILDPVCDMVVDVEQQRQRGLVAEHAATTYAFCGPGCKRAFEKDPAKYAGKVASWEAREHGGHEHHHG